METVIVLFKIIFNYVLDNEYTQQYNNELLFLIERSYTFRS